MTSITLTGGRSRAAGKGTSACPGFDLREACYASPDLPNFRKSSRSS